MFNGSSNDDGLSVGWGLSFLIDDRVIFDTGEKGDLLANNIHKLKVGVHHRLTGLKIESQPRYENPAVNTPATGNTVLSIFISYP